MKQFVTAAKSHEESDKVGAPVEITLDDRKLTFMAPEGKTFLMLMSIYAEIDSGNHLLALGSQINLIFNLLEGDDRAYMRRRMFDPRDDLGEEELLQIFRYLMEEWSGNPTDEPSGSDSPQSPSGTSLTGTASPQATVSSHSTSVPTV